MKTRPAYILAHHVLTPLGSGTSTNLDIIASGQTAVIDTRNQVFQGQGICGALFTETDWESIRSSFKEDLTNFEAMLMQSIQAALTDTDFYLDDPGTVLILASTKGNIGELQDGSEGAAARAGLHESAKKLGLLLNYHSRPLIISNACISGMTALLVAKRLLQSGQYRRAVVAGGDCISPFIIAGFKSFQALSPHVCKPFDKDRSGLNLGEGAATILLSSEPGRDSLAVTGGASTNDANHISGPSRTGAEMAYAIQQAMKQAGVRPGEIGFISAHGTATPFNDEMESKAFQQAELEKVPAFSLKASFGHTLGAAGLLESAISIEALQRGWILPSAGYLSHGVTAPVTISTSLTKDLPLQHFLKTGSGFGGCNAALVFSKITTQ
ncbi:MAG: beta-ketoacyl synthase [Flavipsychrobacter sp.]|nr:beta-ketoacyl synthase [Flavipsychrobacter sp.]